MNTAALLRFYADAGVEDCALEEPQDLPSAMSSQLEPDGVGGQGRSQAG